MTPLVAAAALALSLAGALGTPPKPPTGGCTVRGNLTGVIAVCETDGDEVRQVIASPPPGVLYRTEVQCTLATLENRCYNPRTCLDPPGTLRYDVLRSTDNGANFTKVSETCLGPDAETPAPPQVTPDLVATRFRELTWPGSPLSVQPPGGRTLVNLATNFLTTNTTPTTQTVTLLGQNVVIEATPTTWTWRHGDDTTQTTTHPGRAYPDLDITHTYTTQASVRPRVDTTYTGRYRLDTGPWTDIPATVTITGPTTSLDILTADPQLIATP